MTIFDHFHNDDPNGTHECIVTELLGPSVADIFDTRFGGERLPAKLALRIAKQSLIALAYLHERGVAHAGTCKRCSGCRGR